MEQKRKVTNIRPSRWKLPKKMWTDYPFAEFDDEAERPAPIRRAIVLSYDGDKYCDIKVDGGTHWIHTSVKAGYLYETRKGADRWHDSKHD